MAVPGLKPLDGKLLDGLRFCAIAYDLFESIQAEPNGLEELRLLRTPRAKKMLEEILPIASYIQNRYGAGCRVLVCWRGGNQPYDAAIQLQGIKVERMAIPPKQHLEVTTAVHPHDHLVREHLHREGFAFGPHGISRDRASRQTVSVPTVRSGGDIENELAERILARIRAKSAKSYPRQTSLLIRCVVHTPVLDDEWDAAVAAVRRNQLHSRFREVVLIEPIANRVATLFARDSRRRSNKRLHLTAAAVTSGTIAERRGRRK